MKEKIIDQFIYIYEPEHPKAFESGYVFEHVIIAEKMLGRYLDDIEYVTHRNGNRLDNSEENLEVKTLYGALGKTLHSVDSVGQEEKAFVPCKFQRPCWKEIRAPIAKKNKIYLPWLCSYQIEGDVPKCSHYWNYMSRSEPE